MAKQNKKGSPEISLEKSTLYLNKMLTEGVCISKINGKVLNLIMNLYPHLYLSFMSKVENESKIPLELTTN